MTQRSMSVCDHRALPALLLALACAACSAPAVNEPAPQRQEPAPSTRPAEPPKELPAPPKAPTPKPVAPSKGEQELLRGVASYEDGDYKAAARQLQAALDLGLDSKRDQARAHKYLAFIVCVSGREKACRDEFNKALDADPKFDLDPAEAGHPVWGPALRSVKAERAAKSKRK